MKGPLAAALLATVLLCIFQRVQITRLRHDLSLASSCSRGKRSISFSPDGDDEDEDSSSTAKKSIYFPVYAQISRKAMRKLCEEHRLRPVRRSRKGKGRREEKETRDDRDKNDVVERIKSADRKRCSPDAEFGKTKVVGRRPHGTGCAVRDGRRWLVCEYHMGYTLLEFADQNSLTASLPMALRTLPYPYQGTELAALNGSVAYASDDSVVLFNLSTDATTTHKMEVNESPLFPSSSSPLAVQADEHGLWLLFREKGQQSLSAARFSLHGLKEQSRWSLPSVFPSTLCSAFVRCGVLYTVTCDEAGATARPVFDFYAAIDIVGRDLRLPGVTSISSSQYDASSHSLTFFSSGVIYSVAVRDNGSQ